jgi:hypothetical protein
MMKMFAGLSAEVITQGVSKIHEEFSKFFCAEYFKGTLEEKIIHWQHYMGFRNALSLFRIDVSKLRKGFRD